MESHLPNSAQSVNRGCGNRGHMTHSKRKDACFMIPVRWQVLDTQWTPSDQATLGTCQSCLIGGGGLISGVNLH